MKSIFGIWLLMIGGVRIRKTIRPSMTIGVLAQSSLTFLLFRLKNLKSVLPFAQGMKHDNGADPQKS